MLLPFSAVSAETTNDQNGRWPEAKHAGYTLLGHLPVTNMSLWPEAKHAGYTLLGHLPVTNMSLFLWQTDKHALPQKVIVKSRYPKPVGASTNEQTWFPDDGVDDFEIFSNRIQFHICSKCPMTGS